MAGAMTDRIFDETDEDWLLEHLFCERSMLCFAMEEVRRLPLGNEYNAYHESFVIHARLLGKFLTNGEAKSYGAKDFVQDFRSRKPDDLIALFNRIDPQIMHLAPRRPEEPEPKLGTDDCRMLFDWLRDEFDDFFARLPEATRRRWNGKATGLDISSPP